MDVAERDRRALDLRVRGDRYRYCACPVVEPHGPCDEVLSVDGNAVRNHGGLCEFCRLFHAGPRRW